MTYRVRTRGNPAIGELRAADRYHVGVKRWIDLGVILVLMPLAAPIIAMLWCLVRHDGGPGFFGHKRVGRGGDVFRCWKLRTMVPDAEARLQAHLAADPAAAIEWEAHFKLVNDPRVTRLGRLLRATSLDELPQLWNVLKGEMSLVGPRPVPRLELAEYGGYVWAYLACRPGITGIWQVSGRNAVSYAARVRLDVEYTSRANLWIDLGILLKTIVVVLKKTGL